MSFHCSGLHQPVHIALAVHIQAHCHHSPVCPKAHQMLAARSKGHDAGPGLCHVAFRIGCRNADRPVPAQACGEIVARRHLDQILPALNLALIVCLIAAGHGGADFYTMHYFLEKIQGKPGGEESIDVYTALDMYLPGLLAFRSILNGNVPIEVPNFRIKSEREKYRNDHACTNPDAAGDQLILQSHYPDIDIPDSTYEHVKELWETKFKPIYETVEDMPQDATDTEDKK